MKQRRLAFIPKKNARYRCNHTYAKKSRVCGKKVKGSYLCDEHLKGHPDNDETPSQNVEYQCREKKNKSRNNRRRCKEVVIGNFYCKEHQAERTKSAVK